MGYAKYSEDNRDRRSTEFGWRDIGTGQRKPRYNAEATDAHHLDDRQQLQKRVEDLILQCWPLLKLDEWQHWVELTQSIRHWIAAMGEKQGNGGLRAIDSGDHLITKLRLAKDAFKLTDHDKQTLERRCDAIREKLTDVPINSIELRRNAGDVLQQVAEYSKREKRLESEFQSLRDEIATAMLSEVVGQWL